MPKAREIDPTVPRALEAVCSKAMALEPANRYRRVEDLAEDVRRWIVDEPVSVHRDPLAVRVMRWGRRHRTLATSAAALLLATVIGLTVGVVLIERERGKTEAQRMIATTNATRALHNLRLAQDAADGLLAEVADVDLADIPQMEPVRQRLLEKARAGYQQFLVEEGDDPQVRWGAVRAQVRLGDIQALQGDVPRAEASYRAAGGELENLSKEVASNAGVRRDLARDLHGLGVLLKDANRFQEGEAKLREAIKLREEIANLPDSSVEDKQALVDSRYQLGALLARRGSGTPADLEAYRTALEGQEALVKQFGDRPEFRTKLVRFRNNLAILQRALGSSAESEATLRATLDLLKPSLEGPDPLPAVRWQVARVSGNLGSLLLLNRRGSEEAGAHLNVAETLLRKLTAEFPSVAQYALELASVEYNLGTLATNTGHRDQAVASFKESIQLLEKLKSRFPELPTYRMKLARLPGGAGQGRWRNRRSRCGRFSSESAGRAGGPAGPVSRCAGIRARSGTGALPAWINSEEFEAG